MSEAVQVALIVSGPAWLAAIVSAFALRASLRNGRKADAIKKEVTTLNAQTLAQLADARETRRVGGIPEGNRTAMEAAHLSTVDEQGRGR
jgi:outer membrane murein-binding lipoprotein Lpp